MHSTSVHGTLDLISSTRELGVVVWVCNPSTPEVEAVDHRRGQPRIGETLSHQNNKDPIKPKQA